MAGEISSLTKTGVVDILDEKLIVILLLLDSTSLFMVRFKGYPSDLGSDRVL